MHILVIDDDAAVLRLVVRVLKTAGYAVSTASSGRQALAGLKQRVPDLILSDIRMPDVDGWTLCREVRARYPQLPFVAMSGDMGLLEGNGFDAFVQKPFCIEDLMETVAQAVGRVEASL